MKKEFLSVIGSGGHLRALLPILNRLAISYTIVGVYDDSYDTQKEEKIGSFYLKGSIKDIPQKGKVILAVGDNGKRFTLYEDFKEQILLENLIHPLAYLEEGVKKGTANQIMARSYLNVGVKMGNGNLLNTGSIIEHEASIGNFNHIAPNATISGRVKIKDGCFIGAGATIIDNLAIESNIIVGAGAVVTHSLQEEGVYVGCPARKIEAK